MKVVQINSTCGVGSTGKICVDISRLLSDKNIENYILYSCVGTDYPLGIACANHSYVKYQALKSRLLGNYGFNSCAATNRMIAALDKIQPDLVHIHNIHGHDCNLEILFHYMKEKQIKVIWTFHDCWAFTGYCTHFIMAECEKWKTECKKCVQRKQYSWIWDKSNVLFKKKQKLLRALDMTIVTPSDWLADLVKHSFLEEKPIDVIHNGVNLNVFHPVESDFRKRYGFDGQKLVLGVALGWGISKGVDVFIELACRLPKEYKIILIGTDEQIDKKLPTNILSIHRTQNQRELAEIYSAADVFVNPTREDNYPTVNMEAIACGSPVITFRTGGSTEMLDETCGSVVECNDVDALEREIIRICAKKPYSREQCLKKAAEFDKNKRVEEYIDLYERIIATRD